jgi:hypothetical protein
MRQRFWKELKEIVQVLGALAVLLMLAIYIYSIERENRLLRQMYVDLRNDALAGKVK